MKVAISMVLIVAIVIMFSLGPVAQPAHAVAGTIIAGAVVAFMALSGISILTAGLTSAELQDWVSGKLDEWAADVGSPLDQLINSAGIGMTISGLLTIGTAAAQGINQFISWLQNDMQIQDNDFQYVIQNPPYDLLDYFDFQNYGSWEVEGNVLSANEAGQGACWLTTKSSVNKLEFTLYFYGLSVNETIIFNSVPQGTVFTDMVNCGIGTTSNKGYLINYGPQGSVRFSWRGAESQYIRIGIQFWRYGTANYHFDHLYIDDLSVPDDSSSLAIDTGVITVPQVTGEDKVFIDVGAAAGSTILETTEGILTDTAEGTLVVSGEVAAEEPEYIISGPVSVSGLDDIFPFCIPFDLYHFFEALAADPVAPNFEWHFTVPQLNFDQVIAIDLSAFNTVAQILRTMELLLFAVGLAFETRKLLRS